MATLPPIPFMPGPEGAPPPAAPAGSAPQSDMGALLGREVGPQPAQAPPVDETVRSVMTQIGQASSMLEDMARQFPWAIQEGKSAQSALIEYGMAIVRGLSGPGSEPMAPNVIG